MKLAIFSGTFDPIHSGHVEVAKNALQYVDKVCFVVEPTSWIKTDVTDLKHREAMVRLSLLNHSDLSLLDNIGQKSHTATQIDQIIAANFPDQHEVYLLMGTDNFLKVNKWRDYDNCRKYKFIVAERNLNQEEDILAFAKCEDLDIKLVKYISKVSSSIVRSGDLSSLNPKVRKYIILNNLYNIS